MIEQLNDPQSLAFILAVFSGLISMFACLYVWISDNRQYLQAETIHNAMNVMEQQIQRLRVQDKFSQEMYNLVRLRENIGIGPQAEPMAHHYMLLFFDYMYRAFRDWQDTLLGDREFGHLIAQFITFWYPRNTMADKNMQEWWLTLSASFHDPAFRDVMNEAIKIASDYQKSPELYDALLQQTDALLAAIMSGDPGITDIEETLVPVQAEKKETETNYSSSDLSAYNGWKDDDGLQQDWRDQLDEHVPEEEKDMYASVLAGGNGAYQ